MFDAYFSVGVLVFGETLCFVSGRQRKRPRMAAAPRSVQNSDEGSFDDEANELGGSSACLSLVFSVRCPVLC
jgi:hypothetical protein